MKKIIKTKAPVVYGELEFVVITIPRETDARLEKLESNVNDIKDCLRNCQKEGYNTLFFTILCDVVNKLLSLQQIIN